MLIVFQACPQVVNFIHWLRVSVSFGDLAVDIKSDVAQASKTGADAFELAFQIKLGRVQDVCDEYVVPCVLQE